MVKESPETQPPYRNRKRESLHSHRRGAIIGFVIYIIQIKYLSESKEVYDPCGIHKANY